MSFGLMGMMGFGFGFSRRRNHDCTGDGGKITPIDYMIEDDRPVHKSSDVKAKERQIKEKQTFRSKRPGENGLYHETKE